MTLQDDRPPLTWPALENPYSIAAILAVVALARQIGIFAAALESGVAAERALEWIEWAERGEEQGDGAS